MKLHFMFFVCLVSMSIPYTHAISEAYECDDELSQISVDEKKPQSHTPSPYPVPAISPSPTPKTYVPSKLARPTNVFNGKLVARPKRIIQAPDSAARIQAIALQAQKQSLFRVKSL